MNIPFPHKIETVITVEYGDLEKFIAVHYGRKKVSIPSMEECINDTSLTITVTGPARLDNYDLALLDQFAKGKEESYLLRTIIQDLVNRCYLPPAKYLINISW